MNPFQTTLVVFGFSAVTFHVPFLQAFPTFEVTQVVSSRPEQVA
jgi:scyllo-inositol 2-dehydrogenase (NADP+)